MFDVEGLPGLAARLWEATAVATGGRHNVTVSVGPDDIQITRMAILEAIFTDDPPTRDQLEAWVISTAQRLGFAHTELTENGTAKDPGRMSIRIPLEGFTVTIEGFWQPPPGSDDDLPECDRPRPSTKRTHLSLVRADS